MLVDYSIVTLLFENYNEVFGIKALESLLVFLISKLGKIVQS